MAKINFSAIAKTFGRGLKERSPEILVGIGIVGMIGAAIMAVKATPKALEQIKETERETKESLTPKDTFKVTWRNYVPSVVNRVVVNPELMQIPVVDTPMSVQTLKAENEIARMLDTLDYDKNAVRKKMLKCVSMKYADIDSAPYIAYRMKAALAEAEPLSAFSLPLFKRTVQAIHLEKDGTVSIRLINDQVVGKDDESATGNGNAEESGTEDTCQNRYR